MTPLRCQTIFLLAVPAVSGLVTRPAFRPLPNNNNNNNKISRRQSSRPATALSLGLDPTDALHHANSISSQTPAMDAVFSTMLTSILPNTSLPPLSETIQSGLITAPDLTTPNQIIIPDMPSMPGGVPRSGNPFLTESFRELFNGPMKYAPQSPQNNLGMMDWTSASKGESIVIPARELDVTARYADLLNRIPVVAALYACLDFFLLNAEEDIAIVELLDEEEAGDVLEVEGAVLGRRLMGLMVVVAGTVLWSELTYHPVPFGQL